MNRTITTQNSTVEGSGRPSSSALLVPDPIKRLLPHLAPILIPICTPLQVQVQVQVQTVPPKFNPGWRLHRHLSTLGFNNRHVWGRTQVSETDMRAGSGTGMDMGMGTPLRIRLLRQLRNQLAGPLADLYPQLQVAKLSLPGLR